MIEKFKSVLLCLLVFTSLLQSYMLVFRQPKYDVNYQAEYVQADSIGTRLAAEDLLFPEYIILHFGKERHTVLYPNTTFYNMIFEPVKQRMFDGFRRSNVLALSEEWQDIRNKQQGIEIRFRNGIPSNVLKRIMQIKGEVPLENNVITRIWFYTKDNREEVKTFFFTDNPFIVYEATKADLNIKDMERFIGLGEFQPLYQSSNGEIYLPEQPLQTVKITMPYEPMTAEQLQNSLFVDPSNTRNFKDREGSEIYTDGKRGLQIKHDRLWMSYSDPIPQVESKNETTENLLSAVQFINQHGGWNGTYLASKIPQNPVVGRQTFLFRQYVESFPIVNDKADHMGLIRVLLQKGAVSNYERSMIILDSKRIEREAYIIIGGQELQELVGRYSKLNMVVSVFPAYRPIVLERVIELIPGWAVELKDGKYEFLD